MVELILPFDWILVNIPNTRAHVNLLCWLHITVLSHRISKRIKHIYVSLPKRTARSLCLVFLPNLFTLLTWICNLLLSSFFFLARSKGPWILGELGMCGWCDTVGPGTQCFSSSLIYVRIHPKMPTKLCNDREKTQNHHMQNLFSHLMSHLNSLN